MVSKTLLTLAFLAIAIIFTACGSGGGSETAVSNTSPTALSPVETPKPEGPKPDKVTFESEGGAMIVGSFYKPAKAGSPGVLLLHQWQSDRQSWNEFAADLQKKGYSVLAIDGRGFGESVKDKAGKEISPERTDEAVNKMLSDVNNAFEFLAKQENIDPKRIGIIGASYGSSLAIIFAGANDKVKAVGLLSPGVNYFGNMQTMPAVESYGDRPLMLVAAKDDPESAAAVDKLSDARKEKNGLNLRVYEIGGHGTNIFGAKPGLKKDLETFLEGNLK